MSGRLPASLRARRRHDRALARGPASCQAGSPRACERGGGMTEREARTERDADFVQSLERGLAVICTFDRNNAELTLREVATLTGVTRATTRPFLLTPSRLGYGRTDGRVFSRPPLV